MKTLLRSALLFGFLAGFITGPSAFALEGDDPLSAEEIDAGIERGVEILLDMQESLERGKNKKKTSLAEWPYEGVYRVGGEIPIGYRIGGTSISAWSLLDAPGWDDSKERREAVWKALDFVLERLDDPLMESGFKGGYDVRGWGHAYALTFLLRLRELERLPPKNKRIEREVDKAIEWLTRTIQETEIEDTGGWNYSRRKRGEHVPASPFMTASTLQALFAAAAAGEKVDAKVIDRALATIEVARREDVGVQYASNPGQKKSERSQVPGSIARLAICETTLLLAGRGDTDALRDSVEFFFMHWEELEKRRKQTGTHVPPYGVAPYYFFYGHLYVAQAIEMLPEAERAQWRDKLYAILFSIREESGGWNDRVFPRSENFGTAMVLLALARPNVPAPAAWNEK